MTITVDKPITPEFVEVAELTLTNLAAAKVRSILAERNLPSHGLRVFVAGGGCSGMQYGMAIEGQPREFDTVVETDGVKLYVDPTSMNYLVGATIDYVDNLMGGGFRVENPNAVASCGCGHSFRTAGSAAQGQAQASGDDGCGCGH
ncbi:MAG: iron-sulfur cluster insertion protein ErpA [Chloroflexi bacterium]|nr:iron-sulfur cluster insertion protein ErpA [Chloroflexota bacterium]